MTHTPGPWIWADLDRGLYGAGPKNAVLEYYDYEGMHLSGKTEETQKANALLIAAAPDLLETLAAALTKLEVLWQELDAEHGLCRSVSDAKDNEIWPQIVSARAAIAKATGEK